jgi:hypothetical protein
MWDMVATDDALASYNVNVRTENAYEKSDKLFTDPQQSHPQRPDSSFDIHIKIPYS